MNSFKIKPYLFQLIKENIYYIIFCLTFIFIIVFLTQTSIGKISVLDEKYQETKNEVDNLQTRFDLLNTNTPSKEELDQDIKLLNGLIPDTEDYFSIIYALDELSRDTGFIITSYTVNMRGSTDNQLKLSINGTGDTDKFLNFLKSYNFSGGRLITSDKIELNAKTSGQIKIDLTFYNKKIDANYQNMSINKKVLEDITSLKSKVSFDFGEISASSEAGTNLSYPTKNNPFE